MAQRVTAEFGIRADGQDAGMTFPTLHDAEGNAVRLFARGFTTIEIFRRMEAYEIARPGAREEA